MLSQTALTRRPSNKRQCSDPECHGIITDFFSKDCPDCRQKKRAAKHGHSASGCVLSTSTLVKPKLGIVASEEKPQIRSVNLLRPTVPPISQDRVVSSVSSTEHTRRDVLSKPKAAETGRDKSLRALHDVMKASPSATSSAILSQARKLASSGLLTPPTSASLHARSNKKPRIDSGKGVTSSVKHDHQRSQSSSSLHTPSLLRLGDDHVAPSASMRKPAPFPMTAQDMAPTPAPPDLDDLTDVEYLLETSLPMIPVSKKFPISKKSAVITSSTPRLGSERVPSLHPNKKRKTDASVPPRITAPVSIPAASPRKNRKKDHSSSPLISSPVLATIDSNLGSVSHVSLPQPENTAFGEKFTKACSTCHQEMPANIKFKQCDTCRERGREQARRFTERKRQMQLGEMRISSPSAAEHAEQELVVDKAPKGSKGLTEPQEFQTSSLMYTNLKKKKRSRKTFNFCGTFAVVADPRASLVRHVKHAHRDLRKFAGLPLGDLVSESNAGTIASAIYRCACTVTTGPTLPEQSLAPAFVEPCKGMISIDISVDASHAHLPGERTTIRVTH